MIGAVVLASVAAARQFLRDVLRLEERQDRLAVALVEVVGLGDALGPVGAVAVSP